MANPLAQLTSITQDTLRRVAASVGGAGTTPFTLATYPGFPFTEWQKLQARYKEYQDWYDGVPLDETIPDPSGSGDEIDKFPIKINPIPNSCEKHATILLGNPLESIRDEGVPISFSFNNVGEDRAKIINQAVLDAFIAGGGGSTFSANAQLSQYLGGCVFGVAYRPGDKQKVQVIAPEPTEFIAYPDGLNYWSLRESWFVRRISAADAKSYGYPVGSVIDLVSEYYYIEHYTKEFYRVSINDMTIIIDGVALEGRNPYEVVPYIYIPHIRIKGFWGISMITKAIKGIIKEMNLRYTDVGDAVEDDSHTELFTRGTRTAIKGQKLASGRVANDLGSSPGLSPNDTEPDAFAVQTKSASEPMIKLIGEHENLYRREARHPAVADGEDEGSQRSSLTLTTRMLPLVSHVHLERLNWTLGMTNLVKIILQVCAVKGQNDIAEADLECKPVVKWAPMLPRDREELVNEVAIRRKNYLISQRHAVEMFQDVDDLETELALIDEDLQKEADRAMKLAETQKGDSENSEGEKRPQEQNSMKKEE